MIKNIFSFISISFTTFVLKAIIFFMVIFQSVSIIQADVNTPDFKPSAPSEIKKVQEEEENRREALEIYKAAEKYSNSGDVDKAILEYRKALEKDPNLAEAHLNLGWSYALKRSNYDIALQETLEAIRIKPDMNIAYRNLWWIYRLLNNYDKALETLKKIVEIEPDNPVNYINLGDAYLSDMKKTDPAIQAYQKGLKLDEKNFFIHRKLAKAYEFQKKYDKAEEEFKKAIELNPTDPYTYLFLAVSLGKSGKQEDISPLMKKAYEALSEKIPAERWDIKLLKFYAGEIAEEEIFKNTDLFPIHKCQALYYSGMKYIWEGNKAKGKNLLEEAKSLKIEALSEYEYSKLELYFLENETKK